MTSSAPEAAVSRLLPLPASGTWDWEAVFGRRAPVILEVGSGKGVFLAAAARACPQRDFFGVEIRRRRVEKIAARLLPFPNARVAEGDVRVVLGAAPPGSLSACWVNFPDPWPKHRHAGRCIFTPSFAADVSRALAPGAELVASTDLAWYAAEILLACMDCPDLENPWGPARPAPRPEGYPVSIHEEKFRAWGRPVYFLRFRRRG